MLQPVNFRSTPGRRQGRGRLSLLVSGLLTITFLTPITAGCQRTHSDSDRGIVELRSLVDSSSGTPGAAELLKIEKKYAETRAAALARFLLGYQHYSSQNYQAAADALDPRVVGAHSSLGDYALFYKAESESAVGSKSEAVKAFRGLTSNFADSLMLRTARLQLAELALASGKPADAIAEVAGLSDSKDPDGLLLTAKALEAMGKADQAKELYRTIYFELPATTASPQAEARLRAFSSGANESLGSMEQERSRADALYRASQYWDAARVYQDLLAKFPDLSQDEEIQYRLGVSLLNSRQPADAVVPLSKVGSREREMHASAQFHLAEALRRSNRASQAAVVVDKLVGQYPRTRSAEDALFNLAGYLLKQGRSSEAGVRFGQLLRAYPKGKYAAEASYQLGWQAYQSKRYADAARLLQQHLSAYRYPETKFTGEACLWAGKAEERLGNRARALALYSLAVERYRYGYHGYIATLRIDRMRAHNARLKAEEPKPGSDLERIRDNVLFVEKVYETADGSEAVRLARADDLEVIGLTEFAIKELNKALESAPDSPRLNLRLAQMYSKRGESFQATLILRRGYPDLYSYRDSELPREAWEVFFPLSNWETIKAEAKRYEIDPYLVAGLIRQESVFNPTAVSRAGARGLMQVMPATGQLVAKQQGTGRITASDLFNPTLNIRLGIDYLAQMLDQLGRFEYAAAGYNAGPGRAKRWVAERGSLDIEDWIESIPFTETRGYVQGVLRYAANYRRFYKE